MIRSLLLFLVLSSVCSVVHSQTKTDLPKIYNTDSTQYLEIYINSKGKLLVNGSKMKLEKLDSKLKEIKEKRGFIKFAKASMKIKKVRESNVELSKLLSKHKIIIHTYTDSSFSKLELM